MWSWGSWESNSRTGKDVRRGHKSAAYAVALLKQLFAQAGQSLLELLDRVVIAEGVHVAFGEELDIAELRRCALVAATYGRAGESPQGVLGVIGPSRMDFRRVIPLVEYCSTIVSKKLALADESGARDRP